MTKVKLTNMQTLEDGTKLTFEVSHNNGKTTLRQDLVLTRGADRMWTATMEFKDFPRCDTAKRAVDTLEDWMHRLADAMELAADGSEFEFVRLEDIGL